MSDEGEDEQEGTGQQGKEEEPVDVEESSKLELPDDLQLDDEGNEGEGGESFMLHCKRYLNITSWVKQRLNRGDCGRKNIIIRTVPGLDMQLDEEGLCWNLRIERKMSFCSNPVRALIFFKLYFHYFLNGVHKCEDRFHIRYVLLFLEQSG